MALRAHGTGQAGQIYCYPPDAGDIRVRRANRGERSHAGCCPILALQDLLTPESLPRWRCPAKGAPRWAELPCAHPLS